MKREIHQVTRHANGCCPGHDDWPDQVRLDAECGRWDALHLEHVGRNPMPEITRPTNRHDQFRAEANATTARAREELVALEKQIHELKCSVKDKKEMLSKVSSARSAIGASIEFVAEQFSDHMEKVTTDAMIEVNAYVTNAVQRAELDAISAKVQFQLDKKEK